MLFDLIFLYQNTNTNINFFKAHQLTKVSLRVDSSLNFKILIKEIKIFFKEAKSKQIN